MRFPATLAWGLCLTMATTALAQGAGQCHENAMIVFDASGSMAVAHRGQIKIDTARAAIADVLPEVTGERRAGLVTYAGCSRVELRVPPDYGTAPAILNELTRTQARGDTPLTHAVGLAYEELAKLEQPGVIVLVTDGLESCSGKPCRLAERITRDGKDIKVHVIGFALTPEVAVAHMSCLTQASGGVYVHTETLNDLRAALRRLLTCPLYSKRPERPAGGLVMRPFRWTADMDLAAAAYGRRAKVTLAGMPAGSRTVAAN